MIEIVISAASEASECLTTYGIGNRPDERGEPTETPVQLRTRPA
jgi:hypothetical protein